MPTEKQRLEHILKAIEKIEKYSPPGGKMEFLSNEMIQDAFFTQFSIIGEAIIYVDNDKLKKYPYPWNLVRRFRNYITHEYFGINLEIVWDAAEKDLPELKIVIMQILENEFN